MADFDARNASAMAAWNASGGVTTGAHNEHSANQKSTLPPGWCDTTPGATSSTARRYRGPGPLMFSNSKKRAWLEHLKTDAGVAADA